MIAFGILGIMFLIWGSLYLFSPDLIDKLNIRTTKKVVDINQIQKRHRIITGILYIVVAIFLTIIGFDLKL